MQRPVRCLYGAWNSEIAGTPGGLQGMFGILETIAAYLKRDVRTVQRWERDWKLPVRRLPGGSKSGVFAWRSELDSWLESKGTVIASNGEEEPRPGRFPRAGFVAAACGMAVLAVAGGAVALLRNSQVPDRAEPKFTPFATSLPIQACPAWSPDGKSIAFSTKISGRPRLPVQSFESSTPLLLTAPGVGVLGGGDPVWCR